MSYQNTSLAGVGGAAIGTVTDVLSDPCLAEVIGNSRRLYSAIEAMKKVEKAPATPSAPTVGVGLCALNGPLKAVVYAAEKPWVVPLAVSTLVGGFILIGYLAGRSAAKKR